MAVDTLQVLDIIEVMEAFLERKRPPEAIRHKVDVGYNIDGQSVIIHEIRSSWEDSSKIIYPEIAKATFVKARNHWKVFWLQADLKWHGYAPDPTVETLADFVMVVEADEHGCFWGWHGLLFIPAHKIAVFLRFSRLIVLFVYFFEVY